MPPKEYLKLLKKRRAEYKTYTPLFCSCLNEVVTFNSEGFNHLRFKAFGQARSQAEQIHKISLLPFVREVIAKATSIDEHRKIKNKDYWALVAPVSKGKLKIRVIIRKGGVGKVFFWSVMRNKNK